MAAQHLATALTLLRKQDDSPVDPLTLETALWENCGDVSDVPPSLNLTLLCIWYFSRSDPCHQGWRRH